MFWFGVVVVLASSIFGIGVTRSAVRQRYPWIGECHMDIVAWVCVAIGVALSIFDHFDNEATIVKVKAQLAAERDTVKTVTTDVRIRVLADTWGGGPPPNETAVLIPQQPMVGLRFRLRDKSVRSIELFATRTPDITPLGSNGTAVVAYQASVKNTSWICGLDVRQLVSVERIDLAVWGVSRSKVPSGHVRMPEIEVDLRVNERPLITITNKQEATIELPKNLGAEGYGSIFWTNVYSIKHPPDGRR